MEKFDEFVTFRKEMNRKILDQKNLEINRFFALDERVYEKGTLDGKTKELMGLVASLVLRCDDCISHHLIQARAAGATRQEFLETFSIGLVVGGSIVIPHLRKAVDFLEELEMKV